MSKHVYLADDKMANIPLHVHTYTFIAQNLPKYHQFNSLYTPCVCPLSSVLYIHSL